MTRREKNKRLIVYFSASGPWCHWSASWCVGHKTVGNLIFTSGVFVCCSINFVSLKLTNDSPIKKERKERLRAGWSFQVYITINTALPKEEGHLLRFLSLIMPRMRDRNHIHLMQKETPSEEECEWYDMDCSTVPGAYNNYNKCLFFCTIFWLSTFFLCVCLGSPPIGFRF